MTALKEFEVLTSSGLWRTSPQAQRRDVFISFCDATLVLSDAAGRVLSHWSLPAVYRVNRGKMPAIYSPDPEGFETLEIDDLTMIGALEVIQTSLKRQQARPGKLRFWLGMAALTAFICICTWGIPKALNMQIKSAIGPKAYLAIDAQILQAITRLTGPACQAGDNVTLPVSARIGAPIFVLSGELAKPLALPGGTLLLDAAMVQLTDDPAVSVGYALAAKSQNANAIDLALDEMSIAGKIAFLSSGELRQSDSQKIARSFVVEGQDSASAKEIVATFNQAEVALLPWVGHQVRHADETEAGAQAQLALLTVAAEEQDSRSFAPVMRDDEWLALQNICGP